MSTPSSRLRRKNERLSLDGHSARPPVIAVTSDRAERALLQRGLQFTPLRRQILDMLIEAGRPLGAYDLLARQRERAGKPFAPTQIYRVLDVLQAAGLIHRLATQGTYVVCDHEHAAGETPVFLVCGACGSVAEAASTAVEQEVEAVAAASGFKPIHPVVEVEGRCAACRAGP